MVAFAPLHPSISVFPSPNRHPRKMPEWLATVIHFTASKPGARGDISWLCNPQAKASAHFVIDRAGVIAQLVPLTDCAWHAGISQLALPSGVLKGCNGFTLGIELDNHGPLVRDVDLDGDGKADFAYEEGAALKAYVGPPPVRAELSWPGGGPHFDAWWEPFPEPQLEALGKLLGWIADAGHKMAAHNLVGHEEISLPFGRKRDPGPLFPWERFGRRLGRLTSSRLVPDPIAL